MARGACRMRPRGGGRTCRLTSGWRGGGQLAGRRPGRSTAGGRRRRIARIRSRCWRSRRRPGCRSWCRSGMGGCLPPRSPSTGARRRSWRPTWRPARCRGSPCSCAGMRTCRTSACSAPQSGSSSSTSTTSTRPSPDRGSGTSSGWRPALRSWAASAVFPPTTGVPLSPPGCASTGSGCAGPPTCRRWACGMTSSKPGCCSTWSASRSASSSWTKSQHGARKSMWPRPTPTTAPGCSPSGQAEVGGELRIAADPPVIVPVEDLVVPGTEWEDPAPLIKKLLAYYRRTLGHQGHPLEEFRYVHAARKVVGVGSVGTRCYILLFTGRDNDDPLFLQVKEAQASVLEPYAGASTFPHHGQRVVMGQRLMQAATDIFLGWQRIKDLDGVTRDYYVRQFHDWKGGADVERLSQPGATQYARFCGATLARAHARWGDRIAIASYLGQGDMFDRAIASFSAAYADQNERDYQAFTEAVNSGRLTAQTGV